MPDARAATTSPERFRRSVAAGLAGVDVLVGHSGAGAFLPILATDAGARAVVFVDAIVPAPDGPFVVAPGLVELLDALPVVDGRLAPWHEWWPAAVLAAMVPDEAVRRELTAEIPRVPRSFYDEPVPTPVAWHARPAAFLRLSAAYDEEASRAEGWGWPVTRLDGQHLDVCTRPSLVAEHVHDLVRRLDPVPT